MYEIKNHGPLILSTDYWGSAMERAGKFYVSVNAGAFRLLVPATQEGLVPDMRAAKGCAVSRGRFHDTFGLDHLVGTFREGADAIEILFDDLTTNPIALHFSPESFDRLPTAENAGREWVLSVWTQPRRNKPHKVMDRPCRYRLAAKIPDLRPWDKY